MRLNLPLRQPDVDPQLAAQLAQVMHWQACTGNNSSGDPIYGGAVSAISVRIEQHQREIRRADGSFKTSTHWIATTSAIGMNDRLWLPGVDSTDATLARLPLTIEQMPDERGAVDHYEILLSSSSRG